MEPRQQHAHSFKKEESMPARHNKTADGTQYTFINRDGITENDFIYRIIPKDRLYKLFNNQQNVLLQPSKWEDPFENFILKSPVQTASGQMGKFSFHDDFYGQCWTLHRASDAMWRIYSPKKDAIRIRTTIDRLASSLSKTLGNWAHVQCFIGKVNYLSEKHLKKFAASVFANNLSPDALAQSLLVKRSAFQHEREVRLLYLEREPNVKHPKGLYRYNVDPHELIDQIMVDPRLPINKAEALMNEITQKTGFKGRLKRSLLYAPPKGFLIRIP
jgi:hypothetical protein